MKTITEALSINDFKRVLRSLAGLTSLSFNEEDLLEETPFACLATELVNSAAFAPSIRSTVLPP